MNNDFDPNSLKPFEKLINEAGMPTANILGKALGGIFGAVFYLPAKLGIYTQAHLKDYETRINKKLEQIPEDNKDSTKLGLLFKEIEDSKYQLDDSNLREMFAELISATVDNRKNSNLSPRYPLIISQLSSTDAKFLDVLGNNKYSIFPCFQVIQRDPETNGSSSIAPKEIGLNFNINTLISNDSSLDVLSSLGILTYSNEGALTSKPAKVFYANAEKESNFIYLKKKYTNQNSEIEIEKGYLKFTEFGKEFAKVICQSEFFQ